MTYIRHNFADGQILYAASLDDMEDELVLLDNAKLSPDTVEAGTGIIVEARTGGLPGVKITSTGGGLPLPEDATVTATGDIVEVTLSTADQIGYTLKTGNGSITVKSPYYEEEAIRITYGDDSNGCFSSVSHEHFFVGTNVGTASQSWANLYGGGAGASVELTDGQGADMVAAYMKSDEIETKKGSNTVLYAFQADPTSSTARANQLLNQGMIEAGTGVTIAQRTDASGTPIAGIKISAGGGGMPLPEGATASVSGQEVDITTSTNAIYKMGGSWGSVMMRTPDYEVAALQVDSDGMKVRVYEDSVQLSKPLTSGGTAVTSLESTPLLYMTDTAASVNYKPGQIEASQSGASATFKFLADPATSTDAVNQLLSQGMIEAGSGISIAQRTDASGTPIRGIKLTAVGGGGGLPLIPDSTTELDGNMVIVTCPADGSYAFNTEDLSAGFMMKVPDTSDKGIFGGATMIPGTGDAESMSVRTDGIEVYKFEGSDTNQIRISLAEFDGIPDIYLVNVVDDYSCLTHINTEGINCGNNYGDAELYFCPDPDSENWDKQILSPELIQAGPGIAVSQADDGHGNAINGVKISQNVVVCTTPAQLIAALETAAVGTTATIMAVNGSGSTGETVTAQIVKVANARIAAFGTYVNMGTTPTTIGNIAAANFAGGAGARTLTLMYFDGTGTMGQFAISGTSTLNTFAATVIPM